MSVLTRADEPRLEDIDKGCNNKWKWEWMEKTVTVNVPESVSKAWNEGPLVIPLKDHLRKIDVKGKATCLLCDKVILTYEGRGLPTLKDHLKCKNHLRKLVDSSKNYRLPGASDTTERGSYGAPPAYFELPTSSNSQTNQPAVHIKDRVATYEAMVVGFLAEYTLPFTLSEPLVQLAQELSRDPAALRNLKLHRTTASYKLHYGLGPTMKDELISKLKKAPFALNMDESTSTNLLHVCTVLVCFFDVERQSIVVEHLDSLNIPKVNAENLFEAMKDMFAKFELPWDNLITILMDSASVMRGSKSGLETRIRDSVAPHLVDIDGDSCHHMHNITKNFVKHFGYFLENLFSNIFNDFRLSPDSMELLKSVCLYLGLSFRKPVNYMMCRWLSILDTSICFSYMRDVYTVYYNNISKVIIEKASKKNKKEMKKDKSEVLVKVNESLDKRMERLCTVEEKVYEKCRVSNESRAELTCIGEQIGSKFENGTQKGKERKEKIITRLVKSTKRVTLLTSLYESVLPIFKSYVMSFQKEQPLIHKVYYEQFNIVKSFLSYYVKPEVLRNNKTFGDLKSIKFESDNILPDDMLFVGESARKLIRKSSPNDKVVQEFLSSTRKAYIECGKYMLNKLPLENKALKAASSIDPEMVRSGNRLVMSRLLSLPGVFTNIRIDRIKYDNEVRQIVNDPEVPSHLDDANVEVECLRWWKQVEKKYPTLFTMVTGVLSIFHGPRVESSFSVMGDVIDCHSGQMKIETFDSIQTVKYGLAASQPNGKKSNKSRAVENFKRKDRLYSPIDSSLVKNIRNASSRMKADQKAKRKVRLDIIEGFNIPQGHAKSRKAIVQKNEKRCVKERERHGKKTAEITAESNSSVEIATTSSSALAAADSQTCSPSSPLTTPLNPNKRKIISTSSVIKKKKKQGSLDNFFSK